MASLPISISITGSNNETDLILSSDNGSIVDHGCGLNCLENEEEHNLLLGRINTLEGSLALNNVRDASLSSVVAANASAATIRLDAIQTLANQNKTDISVSSTKITGLTSDVSLTMADVKNIKSGISVSTSAVVTISNDLFVRGKITEYSGLTQFDDYWSGIWEGGTGIICILVRETDLTYTLWKNALDNIFNTYKFPFVKTKVGLKPRQDVCGNYTILDLESLYSFTFQLKWFFTKKETDKKIAMAISPGINIIESLFIEKNTGLSTISNAFLIKTASPGDSYTSSDPVKFIEEYNRQAGELQMKRAFNLDTIMDLKNTWQELGNQLNQSNTGQQTLKFIGSERKIQHNMNQKSFIEWSALHDKLATSTIDYNYKIRDATNQTSVHTETDGKFIIVKYNFRKANESNKITVFDHVKISGTGNPEVDKVPYFKVTRYFHGGYSNSIFGAQIDEKCFQVGLRSPLNISGGTLNFRQKDKYGRDNIYNIIVPGGYYYPTQLADDITELLALEGCELRVLFFNDLDRTLVIGSTTIQSINSVNAQDIPRYVLLSDSSNAITVTAGNQEQKSQDLLTTVLDLSAITRDVSGVPLTNAAQKYFLHRGGTNILQFSPLLVNNISGGTISVTHGNAATTSSPRNYYATVVDMIFSSCQEEHSNWGFKTAYDLNGDPYVPETWNNYQLWLDDKSNLSQIVTAELGTAAGFVTYRQLLNSPAMNLIPGINGPPGQSNKAEYNAVNSILSPYKNILNISDASAIYNAGGYTFRNYLDNTYRSAKETIYADVSGVKGSALISRLLQDNLFNSLVITATKLDVSQVDMTGIVYSGTKVWREVVLLYEHRFGIMKQSVVSKLLPADASNTKVGYYFNRGMTFNTYPGFTGLYPFDQDGLSKMMYDFFQASGVTLVVVDVRGNGGGSIENRRYCPFGPTNVPSTLQIFWPYQQGSPAIREQNVFELRELMKDVLKNPNNYSEVLKTFVNNKLTEFPDGSNNLTRQLNGGIYYPNTRFYNGPSGEGIKVAYLQSDTSISSPRFLSARLHNSRDTSGRFLDMSGVATGNIVFVGTTPSNSGSGGDYATLNKDILDLSNSSYMNNTILNQAVAQVANRSQTRIWAVDDQEFDDKIGEWFGQDAITDHNWDKFLIEIGKKTHPDISGVVFGDNTTWRDLQLEKAVKCGHKGKPALDALGQSYGKLLTDVYQNKLF